MRVLAIGDVFGKPGREAVRRLLPPLVIEERVDVVCANGENGAGGLGTTVETADDLFSSGVNVVTGGNHTWKHRELHAYLDREPRILRPANYPAGSPGRGFAHFTDGRGVRYGVLNLIGRTFLEANADSPFAVADRALAHFQEAGVKIIFCDFHAEASSEKRAMAFHLDGRASAVWGTHTHVPTADEEILSGGTAALSDVGMTGAYRSVIGLDPESATRRFVTGLPQPFRIADGNVQLRALLVDVDDASGRATEIRRLTRT